MVVKIPDGSFSRGVHKVENFEALEKLTDANAKLAADMATRAAPGVQTPKLPILFPEQMTPSVLPRRARG